MFMKSLLTVRFDGRRFECESVRAAWITIHPTIITSTTDEEEGRSRRSRRRGSGEEEEEEEEQEDELTVRFDRSRFECESDRVAWISIHPTIISSPADKLICCSAVQILDLNLLQYIFIIWISNNWCLCRGLGFVIGAIFTIFKWNSIKKYHPPSILIP